MATWSRADVDAYYIKNVRHLLPPELNSFVERPNIEVQSLLKEIEWLYVEWEQLVGYGAPWLIEGIPNWLRECYDHVADQALLSNTGPLPRLEETLVSLMSAERLPLGELSLNVTVETPVRDAKNYNWSVMLGGAESREVIAEKVCLKLHPGITNLLRDGYLQCTRRRSQIPKIILDQTNKAWNVFSTQIGFSDNIRFRTTSAMYLNGTPGKDLSLIEIYMSFQMKMYEERALRRGREPVTRIHPPFLY